MLTSVCGLWWSWCKVRTKPTARLAVGGRLAQLRTIKINDQNTYIKMYELQSICELCRSLCRLSSRMLRVSRGGLFIMTHPLVRPLLPAHLSFLSITALCQHVHCHLLLLLSFVMNAILCARFLFVGAAQRNLKEHKHTRRKRRMKLNLASTSWSRVCPEDKYKIEKEQILIYLL